MQRSRRRFLQLGALAALGVASGAGLRAAEARQRLRVTRHRRTELIDPGASPLLVAQLTDLHVGIATPSPLLREAVEEARRARPDLTVLTGDYLNRSLHHLERLRELIAGLPRPCVATLGNHDHWSGAAEIRRALERLGIAVLANASTTLTLRGRRLTVVGVDDGMTRHADVGRALAGVELRRALVLAHYPKDADAIARRGGRLILSGHTHGGQIALPGVTRGLARLGGHRYVSGWYELAGGARLYVSPGIGSAAIPLRIGRRAAPELALLELV
jgi:hypothetical protein